MQKKGSKPIALKPKTEVENFDAEYLVLLRGSQKYQGNKSKVLFFLALTFYEWLVYLSRAVLVI